MTGSKTNFLIRVYGDSLSLPRSPNGIHFIDTYAELVKNECGVIWDSKEIHLYNRSRGGGNVVRLFSEYKDDCYYFGAPHGGDICIIQCGICDCAPRPLPEPLRDCVGRMPAFLRDRIINVLHRYRAPIMQSGISFRQVPPELFSKVYQEWLASAVVNFSRVYVFNIAPTTDRTETHSPGFSASIKLYNGLIQEAVSLCSKANLFLLDVNSAILARRNGIAECVNSDDGHHITVAGHDLYARLLLERERVWCREAVL